jgi:hypothetical protein
MLLRVVIATANSEERYRWLSQDQLEVPFSVSSRISEGASGNLLAP